MDESGAELRGRLSLSAAAWVTGLLGVVVLVSDLVVLVSWLLRGRPEHPLYLAAGAILVLVTLVVACTFALAAMTVRRQRYVIGPDGITVRGRLEVPWSTIVGLERVYGDEPRERTLTIAVHRVAPPSSSTTTAEEPLYLDLTDVPGGAVRFFALVRQYAPATVRLR